MLGRILALGKKLVLGRKLVGGGARVRDRVGIRVVRVRPVPELLLPWREAKLPRFSAVLRKCRIGEWDVFDEHRQV